MEIVFLWLVFCVVVAITANQRGRSRCGYFLLYLVLSPLVGLVLVLVMRPLNKEYPKTASATGGSLDIQKPVDTKTCPYCTEDIKKAAVVCKHCGRNLE